MNWPGERDEDAWVFGYGSLMWNPCFRYVESRRALLRGYHRLLCILSVRNRGTTDKPGLALGLDRGGSCNGFAFRVVAGDLAEARSLLWQREMPNDAYEPKLLPVRLEAGARVPALAFIARWEHRQYVGDLKLERAAALVGRVSAHPAPRCHGSATSAAKALICWRVPVIEWRCADSLSPRDFLRPLDARRRRLDTAGLDGRARGAVDPGNQGGTGEAGTDSGDNARLGRAKWRQGNLRFRNFTCPATTTTVVSRAR